MPRALYLFGSQTILRGLVRVPCGLLGTAQIIAREVAAKRA
jgi:hypothetical protein